MDTSKASTGGARRHARNISHPVPTPATAAPLDDTEDPLSGPLGAVPSDVSSEVTASIPDQEVLSSQVEEDEDEEDGDEGASQLDPAAMNLGFLQDAEIYHLLGTEDVPEAFTNSENQPAIDATLPDLLQQGHFRRAAETARRAILQSPPDAAHRIFPLLYTRLACLVLLSRPDLAAEEAVPLTDLLARDPAGTREIVPLIPWELRLLLVRLQSIGLQDSGRRSIMSLYALAGEARANLRLARADSDEDSIHEWSARLQDIGLRVCDTLVEMGESETAARHLDTLSSVDPEEIAYRKALLRVRSGDVLGARQLLDKIQTPVRKKGLHALIQTATDHDSDALDSWQELIGEFPGHEVFAQNAAVSMLYAGQITSTRDLLEEVFKKVPMFPTLLFNLSTVYELCTERAAERKAALVRQAAAKTPNASSGGWERSGFEFKL